MKLLFVGSKLTFKRFYTGCIIATFDPGSSSLPMTRVPQVAT